MKMLEKIIIKKIAELKRDLMNCDSCPGRCQALDLK